MAAQPASDAKARQLEGSPRLTAGDEVSAIIREVEAQLERLGRLAGADGGIAGSPRDGRSSPRPLFEVVEELARRRGAIDRAVAAIGQREEQLQAWQERLEALQQRLDAEHEAVVGALEQRRAELTALEEALKARSAEVASRREALAAREASLRAAEGELAERRRVSEGPDTERAMLRATVASLKAALEATERRTTPDTEAKEELARLTGQRDALARELSSREGLVERLSAECASLREEARSALTRAAERERHARRLEGQLAQARAEAAGRMGGLARSRAAVQAGRAEAEGLAHRLDQIRAELDLRHDELWGRARELDEREAELERREAALEGLGCAPVSGRSVPQRSARPSAPGVTGVPAAGLVVPAAWFAWAAPARRRRSGGSGQCGKSR